MKAIALTIHFNDGAEIPALWDNFPDAVAFAKNKSNRRTRLYKKDTIAHAWARVEPEEFEVLEKEEYEF